MYKSFFVYTIMAICTYSSVSALNYDLTLSGQALQIQCQSNKISLVNMIRDNMITIKENWKSFDETHADLKTMFKADLSKQDKKTIRNLATDTRFKIINETSSFVSKYFDALNPNLINSTVGQIKGYRESYFTAMMPYIDINKLSLYNTYTNSFLTQLQTNKMLRLTSYSELLKYIKYCGHMRTLHKQIPGILHNIFGADRIKDELHTQ